MKRKSKANTSNVEHPRVAMLKTTAEAPAIKTSPLTRKESKSSREPMKDREDPANDVVLAAIRVLGTLCIGTAASSNKLAQGHLTTGANDIFDLLTEMIMDGSDGASRTHPDVARVEAACALGCLCLDNRTVSGIQIGRLRY